MFIGKTIGNLIPWSLTPNTPTIIENTYNPLSSANGQQSIQNFAQSWMEKGKTRIKSSMPNFAAVVMWEGKQEYLALAGNAVNVDVCIDPITGNRGIMAQAPWWYQAQPLMGQEQKASRDHQRARRQW